MEVSDGNARIVAWYTGEKQEGVTELWICSSSQERA